MQKCESGVGVERIRRGRRREICAMQELFGDDELVDVAGEIIIVVCGMLAEINRHSQRCCETRNDLLVGFFAVQKEKQLIVAVAIIEFKVIPYAGWNCRSCCIAKNRRAGISPKPSQCSRV